LKSPLIVDLIPRSAWCSNLRSEISSEEWTLVKQKTAQIAGHCCEFCGGKGSQWPVECHERWGYDDKTQIQRLVGVEALCPNCHEATHLGLSELKGRSKEARSQLMKVNSWSVNTLNQHVEEAWVTWNKRNTMTWLLDARWLLSYIPLSAQTVDKLLQHSKGLVTRNIRDY